MSRYLAFWLSCTAGLLLLVAAVNMVVDPYRLLGRLDIAGFNRVKPAAATQGAMAKAYQLPRVQPRTLVLGNSRAEVGLDPANPVWPALPVYNAALPGSGTDTSLRYLQLALAATAGRPALQPRVVFWGIDVMDFLTDPTQAPRLKGASIQAPGWQALDLPPLAVGREQAHDFLKSTLTLSALLDSLQTVSSQRDPYAVDLTPQGFNPMRDYLKISAEEGYWNLFRQKDQSTMRASVRRPVGLFDASATTSPAWEDLKEILRLCRQHGIALHLFSYPYHAHLLESIRLTGHWQAFEDWKRTVVRVLDEEAQGAGQPAFAFWDFSTFNAFTTEAIPPPTDRRTAMRWYWEAGHFKSALGGLLVARMLHHGLPPVDLGVLLTPGNLEAHISAVQAQERSYRQSHPHDLRELLALMKPSSAP